MGYLVLNSTAEVVAVRRVESLLRIVTFVSLCLLGTAADTEAQSPDRVRLSLLEVSPPPNSRSCSLEVVVGDTAGDALLTCDRSTSPVSHLAAHRALTTSEAARLYVLASVPAASRPQIAGSPAPASVDRARVTITITRGTQRVVLDVSEGPERLSANNQQPLRLLREIADELRGTGRR